jgi:Lrp/AsnC family transcriptional regulator, regulator for asnA, asnC and gidA
MANNLKIDGLDKKILSFLMKDARIPFVEIARKCKVSGAAIHQRIGNLLKTGILSGSQFNIDTKKMGYNTCAFIGIQVHLISTRSHSDVFNKIKHVPEIVECHHVSGKYSLLVKVLTIDNEHLKDLIIEKIQSIPEVTATETFISLQEGFFRQLDVS